MTAAKTLELRLEELAQFTVVVDSHGILRWLSRSTRLLGFAPTRLVGRPLAEVLTTEGGQTWERLVTRARVGPVPARGVLSISAISGVRLLECTIHPLPPQASQSDLPGEGALVVSAWDVTEREQHARLLKQATRRDALTGAHTAGYFLDQLRREIRRRDRNPAGMAVLFVNIAEFGLIAQRYGEDVGRHVLIEYSGRLASQLRATDVLARFGSSKFAALCPDLATGTASVTANVPQRSEADERLAPDRHHGPAARGAVAAAQRLARVADKPITPPGTGMELHVPLTLGWALTTDTDSTDSGMQVLAAAAEATDRAQGGPAGPAGCRIYAPV